MHNSRAIAARIMTQVSLYHRSLDSALASALTSQSYSVAELALIKAYCFHTLRWFIQLNELAHQLLHKPLNTKHHDILCLICIGLYELLYSTTPQYAVVNETVNAAQALRKPWAKGLINKILKQFLVQKEKLMVQIHSQPHLQYSHPAWLITQIQQAWPQHWQAILTANNTQAPLFLRVNSLQTSTAAYQQLLAEHHIEAKLVPTDDQALHVITPCPVDRLPQFYAGACSVQDLAGQRVPALLQLQPKQVVLDACAAPGSKTCHLLEYEPALKKIVALDTKSSRLAQIHANIQRLKLPADQFELHVADASQPELWWNQQFFDRILLDAPCSATGVIRRHPDSKLLRQFTDIKQHAQLQYHLLTQLWPLLKPEGLLLYTTCSILPAENSDIIAQFLKTHSDAQPQPISIAGALQSTYGVQLLPTKDGSDGFYYALIAKSAR